MPLTLSISGLFPSTSTSVSPPSSPRVVPPTYTIWRRENPLHRAKGLKHKAWPEKLTEEQLLARYSEFDLPGLSYGDGEDEFDNPLVVVERLLDTRPALGWFKAKSDASLVHELEKEKDVEDNESFLYFKDLDNDVSFDAEDLSNFKEPDIAARNEAATQIRIVSDPVHYEDLIVRAAYLNQWDQNVKTRNQRRGPRFIVLDIQRASSTFVKKEATETIVDYKTYGELIERETSYSWPNALDAHSWSDGARKGLRLAAKEVTLKLSVIPIPKLEPSFLAARRMLKWVKKYGDGEKVEAETSDWETLDSNSDVVVEGKNDVGDVYQAVMLTGGVDFLPGIEHLTNPMVSSAFVSFDNVPETDDSSDILEIIDAYSNPGAASDISISDTNRLAEFNFFDEVAQLVGYYARNPWLEGTEPEGLQVKVAEFESPTQENESELGYYTSKESLEALESEYQRLCIVNIELSTRPIEPEFEDNGEFQFRSRHYTNTHIDLNVHTRLDPTAEEEEDDEDEDDNEWDFKCVGQCGIPLQERTADRLDDEDSNISVNVNTSLNPIAEENEEDDEDDETEESDENDRWDFKCIGQCVISLQERSADWLDDEVDKDKRYSPMPPIVRQPTADELSVIQSEVRSEKDWQPSLGTYIGFPGPGQRSEWEGEQSNTFSEITQIVVLHPTPTEEEIKWTNNVPQIVVSPPEDGEPEQQESIDPDGESLFSFWCINYPALIIPNRQHRERLSGRWQREAKVRAQIEVLEMEISDFVQYVFSRVSDGSFHSLYLISEDAQWALEVLSLVDPYSRLGMQLQMAITVLKERAAAFSAQRVNLHPPQPSTTSQSLLMATGVKQYLSELAKASFVMEDDPCVPFSLGEAQAKYAIWLSEGFRGEDPRGPNCEMLRHARMVSDALFDAQTHVIKAIETFTGDYVTRMEKGHLDIHVEYMESTRKFVTGVNGPRLPPSTCDADLRRLSALSQDIYQGCRFDTDMVKKSTSAHVLSMIEAVNIEIDRWKTYIKLESTPTLQAERTYHTTNHFWETARKYMGKIEEAHREAFQRREFDGDLFDRFVLLEKTMWTDWNNNMRDALALIQLFDGKIHPSFLPSVDDFLFDSLDWWEEQTHRQIRMIVSVNMQ